MFEEVLQMEFVSTNQSDTTIQIGLFEAIVDLLSVKPMFLAGIVLMGIFLAVIFRRNDRIPKFRTGLISLIMYYYIYLIFTNIVGIPTLREWIRVVRLGEKILNPNLNFIPFSDGFSLSFILNIFLFIPLGFLCPMISGRFERAGSVFLAGLGLSALIETSQLFTLYRATDINDLLTNAAGTMVGYLCFKLAVRLGVVRIYADRRTEERDESAYLPFLTVMTAFVVGFFS